MPLRLSKPLSSAARTPKQSKRTTPKALDGYRDFVIGARRIDARKVGVSVDASPAGRLDRLVTVAFPEKEASALHASFMSGLHGTSAGGGRMMITADEAVAIGRRLAEVLFPREVFELFAASLTTVLRGGSSGLRIRLAMDASLLDLPWEYVCRPDRPEAGGVSAFLLLDPGISMIRQTADASVKMTAIAGQQRLAFVGTLWEGKRDAWEVGKEFALLSEALAPVAKYIEPDFMIASDPRTLNGRATKDAAIFHYAGHVDFDPDGRAFFVRELPTSRGITAADKIYVDELAPKLGKSGTRLAVLSACNGGYAAAVAPLLDAGVRAVIGINGGVASTSTIEFCAKLYESIAVGLSLDEAVGRARLHVLEWGAAHGLFDWGLFMVHMTSPDAVLFPRRDTAGIVREQRTVRQAHAETIGNARELARRMDGMNFGEIMSELTQRRVLILGRFTGRRLKMLEAIKAHLQAHEAKYLPELFTYAKPTSRDLVEAIVGFAALARFIIADLSEPRSVQQELEAITGQFQSVPIVLLINRTGREWATFEHTKRRPNVVKPTIRYRDEADLVARLDTEVIPLAEAKLDEVRPPVRA